LAAAGCGTGSYSGTTGATGARPAATSAVASVATGRTKLGTVLGDGKGRTLYRFENDKGSASTILLGAHLIACRAPGRARARRRRAASPASPRRASS
jgi:hypothetical protein